jgi:hypothetical protein
MSLRRGAVDEFHDQDAVEESEGPGHAHAGGGELVQGVHFGADPGGLRLLLPEAGALGHGARGAAVLDLAAFLVLHGLLEAAVDGVLIDLGAAVFLAAAHHIDLGFLAAFHFGDDFIDDAVFHQRHQSFRDFHGFLGKSNPQI